MAGRAKSLGACGAAAAFLMFAPLAHAQAPREPPPRRVVSANVCADQLLLALADPAQIASLSAFAADPAQSYLAAQARAFPRGAGSGETILRVAADLVLTGAYDRAFTRALLAGRGLRFLALAPWTSFAQGEAQIATLAGALGHPDRGDALVRAIEDALARLAAQAATRRAHPTTLVLERRGYVEGGGLLGELAARAGLRDARPALGLAQGGFARLEALVADPPGALIELRPAGGADESPSDQGLAFLAHPALARVLPAARRIRIEGRLAACGGPSTPALVDAFAAAVRAALD